MKLACFHANKNRMENILYAWAVARGIYIIVFCDKILMMLANRRNYGLRVERIHFMNSVRLFPGKYSCSIDCFLELLVTYLGRIRSLSFGGTEFFNLIQSVSARVDLQLQIYMRYWIKISVFKRNRVCLSTKYLPIT